MAQIEIHDISKRFKKVDAVNHVSFVVNDREFFVLFGPAGAGKTTILKIISGIEHPDTGTVVMDGEIVNRIEPGKRNVSMVFENYALYPHWTVYDNIASPMRSPLHKESEEHIRKEVMRVGSMLKIDHLMDRIPSQISNGQKQRVAIGRCIVRKPNVFLMDEPLAHLDAKLKHRMRAELKEMQATLDTTTIYVTHDYLEALSLGDRIAVLNHGQLEQIGTANEVYYTPANQFVAGLFGEPEINIFPIQLVHDDGKLRIQMLGHHYLFPLEPDVGQVLSSRTDRGVNMGIRGTCIQHAFTRQDNAFISGTVYSYEPIGNKSIMIVNINNTLIRLIVSNTLKVDLDSEIFIKFDLHHAMYFDQSDGSLIIRHNQDQYAGSRNRG